MHGAMMAKINKDEEEWRKELGEARYSICRCGGTEAPFTGAYWNTKTKGTYHCAACNNPLFSSDAKYDSGSGWPSFWAAINEDHIKRIADTSHGMSRVEIICASCDSHLGHVFPDGPKPTGERHCVNSASLKLIED